MLKESYERWETSRQYPSGVSSVAALAKFCTCRLLASRNLSFRPCGGISFVRSCRKPATIAVASNEERFLGFAAWNVFVRTRSGTGPDPTLSWSVERNRP